MLFFAHCQCSFGLIGAFFFTCKSGLLATQTCTSSITVFHCLRVGRVCISNPLNALYFQKNRSLCRLLFKTFQICIILMKNDTLSSKQVGFKASRWVLYPTCMHRDTVRVQWSFLTIVSKIYCRCKECFV